MVKVKRCYINTSRGPTQEHLYKQRIKIQKHSLDWVRRLLMSAQRSLAIPRSSDLPRGSDRDPSGEECGQRGDKDYYKEVSGSDQKNTTRCEVVVSGDPWQGALRPVAQTPAVTGQWLCGPLEVSTEAASWDPVATCGDQSGECPQRGGLSRTWLSCEAICQSQTLYLYQLMQANLATFLVLSRSSATSSTSSVVSLSRSTSVSSLK